MGIAESYRGETSTLAAAVVRTDRAVENICYGGCTVGGSDATDAIVALRRRLDRPDVQPLLLAGIAPAWYNLVDLAAVHSALDRPVIAISFEASPGLEASLRREFEGEALQWRLETYRTMPERRPVETAAGTVFVRSLGIDEAAADELVQAFTHESRPEPLRVAKVAARAADAFVHR